MFHGSKLTHSLEKCNNLNFQLTCNQVMETKANFAHVSGQQMFFPVCFIF